MSTPAGDGAAGFLAALIDQLLAGAAASATAGSTADLAGTSGTTTDTGTPLPFGIGLDPTAAAAMQATPKGNVLVAQLTRQLRTLQEQIDSGQTPDPKLLEKLGDTADAIAALIAVPAQPAPAPLQAAAEIALDPLASIGKADAKDTGGADLASADAQATPPAATPALPDQVVQLLASLGLSVPAPQPGATSTGPSDATVGASSTTAPPALPGIAQLVSKLADLSQTLATTSPEVAQKLAALTQKLTAAEADPQAFAQLTAPGDSDGSTLDRVVQALLDRKPAASTSAAPVQLAAKTQLDVPAPIAPSQPKTPAIADATPLAPASNAASAAKVAASAKADDTPSDDTKPAAKIVATVVAKVEAKDTTPDTSNPSATATASAAPVQAQSRILPAAYQQATNPINMGQVAFEMVRQIHQGQSRFSIRLDPPELGRVDVKMHVDASGTVNARLTVERSETLDMFQRDRGSLEKALSQAGLDGAKTNLEFSLKQSPFAGLAGGDQRPNQGQGQSGPRFSLGASADDDGIAAVPAVTLYRGIASAGGVNLFV